MMLLNPFALFASLIERLLNRIAPQPKPGAIAAEKAVVLPFSRQSRPAVARSRMHGSAGRQAR